MGVRLRHGTQKITVKLHGIFEGFPVNVTELATESIKLIHSYTYINDIAGKVEQLAFDLRDKYCDGDKLMWVEVTLYDTDDTFYGTTAEKVLTS